MRAWLVILLLVISRGTIASIIDMTVNVTNNDVNIASVTAAGATVNYNASTKIIEINDTYPDFVNFRVQTISGANHQGALKRQGSLFSLNLKGSRYGKTLLVKGKLTNSRINIDSASTAGFDGTSSNTGCSTIFPTNSSNPTSYFEIKSSDVFTNNCVGQAVDKAFGADSKNTYIVSGTRRFILDMSELFNSDLPLDTYVGQVVYNGDGWRTRLGSAQDYYPNVTIKLKIEKKPFFSGLVLSDNIVNFIVNNHNEAAGYRVSGRASATFNLLGAFSGQDKIKIDARSANNFRLTAAGGTTIPYNVGVTYRDVTIPLVVEGSKQSPVILSPGLISSTATGVLTFDFSTPASQVHNGMFSDNFTLMAELVL